jgi:hypothetical protein
MYNMHFFVHINKELFLQSVSSALNLLLQETASSFHIQLKETFFEREEKKVS